MRRRRPVVLPETEPAPEAHNPSPAGGRGAGERAAPHIDRTAQRRAKHLRGNQTDAEMQIWYQLRAHRFLGLKFKRQKPVGRYIVDFICSDIGLVIELDGGQHNASRREHDRQRDAWLRQQGLTVLRFWNDDVLRDTDSVLEAVRQAVVAKRPSPPAPLPPAGEGSKGQA